MASLFTFDVASEFPGGAINPKNFGREIRRSSISAQLIDLATSEDPGGSRLGDVLTGGTVRLQFDAELTAQDETTLHGDASNPAGGLVAAHDNTHGIELSLDSRRIYRAVSVPVIDQVEYVQVQQVPAGLAFFGVRVAMWSIGLTDPTVEVGVYSDGDGEPKDLLASASRVFTSADAKQIVDIVFGAPLVLAQAQNIWTALRSDVDTAQFVSTDSLLAPFHPVRFQSGMSSLPQTASPDGGLVSGSALFAALVA